MVPVAGITSREVLMGSSQNFFEIPPASFLRPAQYGSAISDQKGVTGDLKSWSRGGTVFHCEVGEVSLCWETERSTFEEDPVKGAAYTLPPTNPEL